MQVAANGGGYFADQRFEGAAIVFEESGADFFGYLVGFGRAEQGEASQKLFEGLVIERAGGIRAGGQKVEQFIAGLAAGVVDCSEMTVSEVALAQGFAARSVAAVEIGEYCPE